MWLKESRAGKLMKWKFENKLNRISFALTDFIYSVKVYFYPLDEHSITISGEKMSKKENSFHVSASPDNSKEGERDQKLYYLLKCGWEKNKSSEMKFNQRKFGLVLRPSLPHLASMTARGLEHLRWILHITYLSFSFVWMQSTFRKFAWIERIWLQLRL